MTTAQQLIHHDIVQSNRIMQRYYKSSSLPFTEKRKHKPEVCKYRRDRVLHAIMNREMEKVLRIIGDGQRARGGGHNDSLSRRADHT